MAENWQLPRIGSVENPLRICIMISGSGSGMDALIKYQNEGERLHKTVLVLSDRSNAEGLEKARKQGVNAISVALPEIEDKYQKRLEHEKMINNLIHENQVELIVLSGYMRILTPSFVKPWAGRILNIHPSLLPDFPGAHAHKDVIDAGVTKTGCTVHFVDSGMDTGPIISQAEVEVYPHDTVDTLSQRVKVEEHRIYPLVIDAISSGNVQSP
ncbi:MAG: phosphoribosylglycinamide formyltransferase [Euryarchaeota archaeon]|nr:phosphoribosylglycinamide formyltransferase [Euryarchaeota archaeon]